jgi:hypothetical protein
MLDDNRRKPLISLEKQIAQPVKPLILHNNEIGTFCIDCTGTPRLGGQSRNTLGKVGKILSLLWRLALLPSLPIARSVLLNEVP